MNKIVYSDQAFVIHQFLTLAECDGYTQLSEQIGYEEATVSIDGGQQMIKGIRNNYRLIYTDEELATRLFERAQAFIPSTIENQEVVGFNEQFRFYRYDPGEKFNKHKDGRFRRNEQEESRLTFMIYLNDNFEGGETEFEAFAVKPEVGAALCFIHELRHKGGPVHTGRKYVLRTNILFKSR
jgi:hypothetical protein